MNTSTMATLLIDLRALVHTRDIDGQLVSIYDAFWIEPSNAQRVSAVRCDCPEWVWMFHTREAPDWQSLDDEGFREVLAESQPWFNTVTVS